MANFQLFFQSGRAKDLSAPLYIIYYKHCNNRFQCLLVVRDEILLQTPLFRAPICHIFFGACRGRIIWPGIYSPKLTVLNH